jgi:hypothetical protein
LKEHILLHGNFFVFSIRILLTCAQGLPDVKVLP